MGFQLFVHKGFKLVRVFCPERNHAQVVTHKVDSMMVCCKCGKLVENIGTVRVFNMRFKGQ